MPSANERRLRQQRGLFLGLALLAGLSALLLWVLRTSDPRQARAARGEVAERAPDALAEDVPPPAAAQPPTPEENRESLAAPSARAAADDAAAFEPDALYGTTLVEDVPESAVELFVFPEELSARDPRAPVARARSDGEGRFRLRGLTPHRRYVLLAQSVGVLPHEEAVFPGEPLELVLTRAVRVEGRVRARGDGRPLAGVELALTRRHWSESGLAEQVSVTSGADGAWQLPWAEVGMQTFLVTRAGRMTERREFQVTAAGGSGFEILLDDARLLELLVVDLAAGVALVDTELATQEGRVRTDANGHLTVPVASDGTSTDWVRVVLSHPGDALTEGRLRAAPPGGPLPRVPVARGGRVRGRVLDASGAPVAEANVRLVGGERAPLDLGLPEGFWLNQPRGSVRTGADGRFELQGCVPRRGKVEVAANHALHAAGRSEPFVFDRLGLEQEVEVRLAPAGSIAGLVTRDGQPLAYTVQWENAERSGWVRANALGAYRIDGLVDGPTFLRPRAEGDWDDEPRPADREVLAVAGQTTTCDLTLVTDEVTIEGRVLDAEGQPVAGVELVAYSENDDEDDEGVTSNSVASARDGSFVLVLPPVSGRLFSVWAEKGPRQLERGNVAPGTRGLELVLPSLGTVAVRVRDALLGEPVQGFRLYWRTSDDGHFQRLDQDGDRFSAGPDGSFQAELPAGRLDLVVAARHLGYLPAWHLGVTVTAEPGAALEFELEAGVELELELTGDVALQNQLRRSYVVSREQQELAARGGDFFSQEIRAAQGLRPDERGLVRLRGSPPGEYAVERLPGGVRLTPATFELPAVTEQRVELRLEPKETPAQAKPGADGR